jgi:hypothetical protein
MATPNDRSLLLALSAEQSRQLQRLVGPVDAAPAWRSRLWHTALGSLLLVACGWLGAAPAATFIQWVANALAP